MTPIEPATADAAAAALAEAAASRTRVVVRGSGTKIGWNQPSLDGGLLLSTIRLNRIIAHRHGDLTATVEAGAVLDDVNRELARQGQWIPLDPNWPDRATIGGIVAANDSGPRRHRFGGPRDLIIGIEIARADGVRAKAGGIVVKNVAGYDLARLMTGSFGSLGVVLNATFKLYPLAEASRTVVVELPNAASARALVKGLDACQLTPTAVEIQMPPLRVLVRFESIAASVDKQSGQTVSLASDLGGRSSILQGHDEEREWEAHRCRPWSGTGAVVKVTLAPSDLPNIVGLITESMASDVDIIGRAGLGVLTVRLGGDVPAQAAAVKALRQRPAGTGGAVLLRASDELRRDVGIWGPMGDAFPIMMKMKRAFDPDGILNPGGGPGGL